MTRGGDMLHLELFYKDYAGFHIQLATRIDILDCNRHYLCIWLIIVHTLKYLGEVCLLWL